jgi:hypothetical protein
VLYSTVILKMETPGSVDMLVATHKVLGIRFSSMFIHLFRPEEHDPLTILQFLTMYRQVSSPCFTPVCFTLFCFNVGCQFTPLLNLRSLSFVLTPVGWLHSTTLTHLFVTGISFLIDVFVTPNFLGLI